MARSNKYPVPAGSLDRRIVVERAVSGTDQFNNPIHTWTTYAELWAAKIDVSDTQRLMSQEVGAEITTWFRVRWTDTTAAITPKDRIRYNGLVYDINGIKDLGRRIGLEISTNAREDTTQDPK